MKSEPSVFSIEDLKKRKSTTWDGIRNFQARNFMMKEMKVGDRVLFYHSNAEPPGVAGIAEVSKEAVPDPSQFDRKSDYFDPKASKEKPIWFCVHLKFVESFSQLVDLSTLKKEKALSKMPLLQKGQRLSVQPVSPHEYDHIRKMAGR